MLPTVTIGSFLLTRLESFAVRRLKGWLKPQSTCSILQLSYKHLSLNTLCC